MKLPRSPRCIINLMRSFSKELTSMRRSLVLILLILLAFITNATAQVQSDGLARLLRFPDIHGDMIAFVYAGDIWTVPASGGTARRLTSHPGLELFPKFSPDGRWIAFSGEYDGTRKIFVISVAGGVPRHIKFHYDDCAFQSR